MGPLHGGPTNTDDPACSADIEASTVLHASRDLAESSLFSDREISFTRLRPDGTLDEAFGPGGLQRMELPFKAALSAAQDGVSYVAGVEEPEHVLSHQRWGLARFSPNGALDTSFGRAGLLYTTLRQGDSRAAPWMNRPIAGVVDGDGRLVLAGALADDTDLQMYFVRYR